MTLDVDIDRIFDGHLPWRTEPEDMASQVGPSLARLMHAMRPGPRPCGCVVDSCDELGCEVSLCRTHFHLKDGRVSSVDALRRIVQVLSLPPED